MNFNFYSFCLILIYSFAVLVFVILFFIPAPYGKFMRSGWGSTIRASTAWMIMEFPSLALMIYFFLSAENKNPVHYIFLLSWLAHYSYRTFLYPFMQSGKKKPYPVSLVIMAFIFNCLNSFSNGYGVFHLYNYTSDWLLSWQFLTGLIIFILGFLINKIADRYLMRLKNGNSEGYVIPSGWLFNYVSSPHYLGEIIEWSGWAMMTFSLSGLAFAVFTFANLFPRAIASHKWYRKNFPDYPEERKAIIPFII